MALTDPMDIYCERIGPEFWSEPINAVTNAAFFLAAGAAFLLWQRNTPRDWPVLFLIGVVMAIGTGSFLFHTVATRWAVYTDTIPITVFIHVYMLLALRRLLQLHWVICFAVVIGFFMLAPVAGQIWAPYFGGSAAYVPAALAIFLIGGLLFRLDRRLGSQVLQIGILFTVSLTIRALDGPLCNQWPLGTHFLWHILNGVVLFGLLRVLIWHRAG
ncbi:hypothetical protein [Roseibium sp.]|uniref:hypothetical protein n=1 Tax=Roseibium sp. TaxID=1936156 RepID=UPI003B51DA8B